MYVTEDYGQTWKSLANGLPDEPINVIREDRVNPNLLFIGTEMRVFVSVDGGASWASMKNNMPTSPVHDLLIHPRENDLVVGTHGRGIFIANIQPLQEVTSQMGNFELFKVRPKVKYITTGNNNSSSSNFNGESEPTGSEIYYYVGSKQDEVVVQIMQGDAVLHELKGSGEVGLQRVVWDHNKRLRKRSDQEKQQMLDRAQRFRSFIGDEQYRRMIAGVDYVMGSAASGTYTVKVTVGGESKTQTVTVLEDEWAQK